MATRLFGLLFTKFVCKDAQWTSSRRSTTNTWPSKRRSTRSWRRCRQAEELKLERQNEQLAETAICAPAAKVLSYEGALLRNTNTLKALEIAKARLRSRSTYSPVEKLLQQALHNYRKELESLQDAEDDRQGQEKPKDTEEEAEEEENLYDLVMQNVIEAKRQQTDL
ncbi:uncharacterized protein LOC6543357 isoform X1 [Drosophila erecta]|uniref:uncharacterized protein LOC6543357 isoform X1 n=1 Tax=Drosophila erecta TaxID=7220 RepID=UPI000F04A0C4|nr:uncharacterized protein LOC6543357 isoform X1 [Drosophila erecta]